MSGAELRDRLRQRVIARSDHFRYKLGIGFDPALRATDIPSRPKFFFSLETVPLICAALKQFFPERAEEILRLAEQVCGHRFDLLGYENVEYGKDIDWHCDRIHNVRAPLKPWFKIQYLKFAEVGDSKITWELNRHQHFVTLAKAYRLSGNKDFAAELFRQWRNWHKANPYPIGINWASSLEVAFRSLSWLWVYFLLDGSPVMPPDIRADMMRAIGINGQHLAKFLSTYFSPNTHLLGEGIALFFIGLFFPQFRSSEQWKRRGWQIVLDEADRQVQADGFHVEQSTYYHVYALDFFLHARVIASANDIQIPPALDNTLIRMLDVLCTLGASGAPPRLGDDDGGRVFDSCRNQAEHMLDPLSTGAVIFRRGDFKSVAGRLREETLWLLGESAIAEFEAVTPRVSNRNSVALYSCGLYVMKGAGSNQQLTIDAGSQGAFGAGHGHADALSIGLNHEGRTVLIDSGTFEYVGAGSDRDIFRGTSAHNTLVVDGLDQAEPQGVFSWKHLPHVVQETWIEGHSFDFFEGSHDGYKRLVDPVLHRRSVFSLKDRFWFVRDQALGHGEHALDLFWHLSRGAPEEALTSARTNGDHNYDLTLITANDHGWSEEILRGWWSPAYGRKTSGHVIHYGKLMALPAEFGTLLMMRPISPSLGYLSRISSLSSGQGSGYKYATADEVCFMFFGQAGSWTMGQWRSDAKFLYWSIGLNQRHSVLICCNCSYAEADGMRILSCHRPLLRCEMIIMNTHQDLYSSDPSVIVDWEALQNVRL